jgi:hypothetical protein
VYTETITQRLGLGAGVAPIQANNQALNTDAVDMSLFKRAFFEVQFGATVGGTVTLSLQESADNVSYPAAGTASPFSGSGGTNVQQALAPPVAGKLYTFEVRADQLSAGKRYVRLNANVSANNNLIAITAFGDEAVHKPGNVNNNTNVATQNVVA